MIRVGQFGPQCGLVKVLSNWVVVTRYFTGDWYGVGVSSGGGQCYGV